MSYISINGVSIPNPKRGIKIKVVTMVDSGRNANAAVVGQRIGRDQYKLEGLEFPWLSAETWSKILSTLDDFFVYVTFTNPVTNSPITIRMYPGDRDAEPYWLDKSTLSRPTFYRNCKFNLIDKGD